MQGIKRIARPNLRLRGDDGINPESGKSLNKLCFLSKYMGTSQWKYQYPLVLFKLE